MKCPNCGVIHEDNCRFCGVCGAALTIEKKGSHRAPIIIMLALSIIGTCIFFAAGGKLAADPVVLPQMDFSAGEDFFVDIEGKLNSNRRTLMNRTEITVPEVVDGQTVTAIDVYGLGGLTDVTVFYLPDTLEEIQDEAFSGCISLRGMDLPDSLRHIGEQAFFGCASLEAVHIPASVEYIGQDAFLGCENLTFIFYDGAIGEWKGLYRGVLPAKTAVCCTDGTFFQSE